MADKRLEALRKHGVIHQPLYFSYGERSPFRSIDTVVSEARETIGTVRDTVEANIWRQARPVSAFKDISVQSALEPLESFISDTRARGGKMPFDRTKWLDIETLGLNIGGRRRDVITEIGISGLRETNPFHKIIRPGEDVKRALDDALERLMTGKGITADEGRALRDLIRFKDWTGGKASALADVMNRPTGTGLGMYVDEIQAGLKNLMELGGNPVDIARDLNDYIIEMYSRGNYLITFKGKSFDLPHIKKFLAEHNYTHLSGKQPLVTIDSAIESIQRRHIDLADLDTLMGVRRTAKDMPGVERQKGLEALIRQAGIEDRLPHTAMGDIRILQGASHNILTDMIDRFDEIQLTADFYQGFDTRPLATGEELFTIRGMRGYPRLAEGAQGIIPGDRASVLGAMRKSAFDVVYETQKMSPIAYMDAPLYRNVKVLYQGIEEIDVHGVTAYAMWLQAPEEGVTSRIVRPEIRELQDIIHQRTVPYKVAETAGLDPLVNVGGRTVRRRQADQAQRFYRRMFEMGEGQGSGERLARKVFGIIDQLETKRIRRPTADDIRSAHKLVASGSDIILSDAQVSSIELLFPRLRSEKNFASTVLSKIESAPGLLQYEKDLAFARAMSRMGKHTTQIDLPFWDRKIQILSAHGAEITPLAAEGVAATRGLYQQVGLATADEATQHIYNILYGGVYEGGIKGTVHQDKKLYGRMHSIVADLAERGVLGEEDVRAVLGTKGLGELSTRSVDRQVDTLVDTLRGKQGQRFMVYQVEHEAFTGRPGRPHGQDTASQAAQEAIEAVARRKSELSKDIFGHKMHRAHVFAADDYIISLLGMETTPLKQTVGYKAALGKIAQVTGGVRKHEALDIGMSIIADANEVSLMFFHSARQQEVMRAVTIDPARHIPGTVRISLPEITPEGFIRYGGLQRMPLERVHLDAGPPKGFMFDIVDEAFSYGKIKRMSEMIQQGRLAEAQAYINRAVIKEVQKYPAMGKTYKDVAMQKRMWTLSPDVMSPGDWFKGQMVDISREIEAIIDQQKIQPWELEKRQPAYREAYGRVIERRGLYPAGKEEDILKGLASRVDHRGVIPFGGMLDDFRPAGWQHWNLHPLDPERVRPIDADPLRRVEGVTGRRLLTTPEMRTAIDEITATVGTRPQDYYPGLHVRTALATDADIQNRIDALVRAGSITEERATVIRQHLTTREGTVLMRRSTLEGPLTVRYDKTKTVDEATARIIREKLAQTEKGLLEVGPLQEIAPGFDWRDLGTGEISAVEDIGGGRARVYGRTTSKPTMGTKVSLMGSEKGTIRFFEGVPPAPDKGKVQFGPTSDEIDLLIGRDVHAVMDPQLAKHGAVGPALSSNIEEVLMTLGPDTDEARRFIDQINRDVFGEKAIRKSRRMNEAFILSQEVSRRQLTEDQALKLAKIISEHQTPFHPYVTHQTQYRPFPTVVADTHRIRHGDILRYSGVEGKMRRGGETVPGYGAKFGFRERDAQRTHGLHTTAEYFDEMLQFHGTTRMYDTTVSSAQGTIAGTRVMIGDTSLKVPEVGIQELRPMPEPRGGRYPAVSGTALQPRLREGELLSPGQAYNLMLPEGGILDKKLLTDLAADPSLEGSRFAKEVLLTREATKHGVKSIPIGVQDYTHAPEGIWVGEIGRQQERLADAVRELDAALYDPETFARTPGRAIGAGGISDIEAAKRKVLTTWSDLYDASNIETMASHKGVYEHVMHGRMPMSGRFTLTGMSPLTRERLGLPENLALMSKEDAIGMLGEEGYSKYFGRFDKHGIAQMKKDQHLMGAYLRQPDVYFESVQPVNVRVAKWLKPGMVEVTDRPQILSFADFDADQASLALLESPGGLSPQRQEKLTKAQQEMYRYWKNIDSRQDPFVQAARASDQARQSGVDIHRLNKILAESIVEEKGTRVVGSGRHTAQEVIDRKAAKFWVGPVTVQVDQLKGAAGLYFGPDTHQKRTIDRIAGALSEHGTLLVKHDTTIPMGGQIRQLLKDSLEGRAGTTELSDFLRDPEKGRAIIEKARISEGDLKYLDEIFTASTAHGPVRTRIKTMLESPDYIRKDRLAQVVDVLYGQAPETYIAQDETTVSLVRKLMGDDAAARLMERDPLKKLGQNVRQASEQMQHPAGRATMTEGAQRSAQGFLDQLPKKITPKMGLWAVGIAAGLYAFQRVRGKSTMMNVDHRPQPDVAPEADGVYPEPMPTRGSPPIPRVAERGTGYDGMRVNVRGTRDAQVSDEEIGQVLAEAMQSQVPVPLNINIASSDGTKRLSKQQIEEIVAGAIRGR